MLEKFTTKQPKCKMLEPEKTEKLPIDGATMHLSKLPKFKDL